MQVSRSSNASLRHAHSATPSIVSDSETFDLREPLTSSPYSSDLDRNAVPMATSTIPSLDNTVSQQSEETVDHTSRDATPIPDLHGNQTTTAQTDGQSIEFVEKLPQENEDSTHEQYSDRAFTSLKTSTLPLLPPSPKGAEFPPHRLSIRHDDSDIETSSVVSVQHLTEAYLNDPFDSAEENLTAGSSSHMIPVTLPIEVTSARKSHTPTPVENKSLGLPRSLSDHRSTTPEPSKLPSHIQASDKPKNKWHRNSSSSDKHSPPTPRLSSLVPSTRRTPSEDGSYQLLPESESGPLRDKLTKALQAKANLEGQLQSVVNECKNTLKDRANLQSKLSQAEAQLDDLTEALEKERQKIIRPNSNNLSQLSSNNGQELKQLRDELEDKIDGEKMAGAALGRELAEEKEHSQKLDRQLTESRAALKEQKEATALSQKKLKDARSELEKKKSELSGEQSKSSSLEASYGALEEAKGWLHQQLQDSMETKGKLQRELSEAKANAIAQSIKVEQLLEENSLFQNQIGQLQRAVLHDKARMVSELEAIEADVISREDSFENVLAETHELKKAVKFQEDMVDKLKSELADALTAKEESEEKAEDVEMKNEVLTHTAKELKDRLQATQQTLCDKESKMEELESGLQESLRDAEAALVGKGAALQGLKDAREIMKQELDMTNDGQKFLETELDETKHQLAMLEGKLKSALKEKDSISRTSEQARRAMAADNENLTSQLMEKDRLLEEKVEELQTLESQSGEIIDHFKNLQDQFQSIATKSGDVQDSVEEKDRVISHLATEKDSMEDELCSLREAKKELDEQLAQLKQEKAHLEGKLDTSPSKSLEEFQKLVRDKSQLQAEVNSLKIAHQGELIKAQAKANHLETELRTLKRIEDQTKREMEEAMQEHDSAVSKLEDENYRLKSELRNASVMLESPLKANATPQLRSSLRQAERERDKLKSQTENLTRQNQQLGEQLEQEMAQKNEIERAGTVVVKKLKQNGQENELKLRDEIQELKLNIEKLTGRLSGMELTQGAMRDHTGGLEVALAKREACLLKLSAQAQRVLEEKELEDEAIAEKMELLEKQLQHSKRAQQTSKEAEKEERKKLAELSSELLSKDRRLKDLEEQLSEIAGEMDSLKEAMADLTTEKEQVSFELNKRLQTTEAQSTLLRTKEAQLNILTQELQAQVQALEGERNMLEDELQLANKRHAEEMEGLRAQLLRHGRVDSSAGNEPGVPTVWYWLYCSV